LPPDRFYGLVMTHIQIVLFDGFDPLDAIGPFEVLTAGRVVSGAPLEVTFVSDGGARRVESGSGGMALEATAALSIVVADVVIVPGASGLLDPDDDRPGHSVHERLAAAAASPLAEHLRAAIIDQGTLVAAVCGGSLILAMAGLIDGRPAVTHHLGMEVLAATGAQPVRARVVDDGDLVTAGGVTSGIDLGLHLLARLCGAQTAIDVEHLFEFERRGTTWIAA
jgi:transcriptional regulator GlxA family with amidase domain